MFFPETSYFPEKLQQVYETDIDVLMKTYLHKNAYISNLYGIHNRKKTTESKFVYIF